MNAGPVIGVGEGNAAGVGSLNREEAVDGTWFIGDRPTASSESDAIFSTFCCGFGRPSGDLDSGGLSTSESATAASHSGEEEEEIIIASVVLALEPENFRLFLAGRGVRLSHDVSWPFSALFSTLSGFRRVSRSTRSEKTSCESSVRPTTVAPARSFSSSLVSVMPSLWRLLALERRNREVRGDDEARPSSRLVSMSSLMYTNGALCEAPANGVRLDGWARMPYPAALPTCD